MSSVTSDSAVSVKDLAKRYGEIEAVRGIDFEVARSEVFGFLGPNGAGKSTTISMLCTLVKPTGGSALVARAQALGVQNVGLYATEVGVECEGTGSAAKTIPGWSAPSPEAQAAALRALIERLKTYPQMKRIDVYESHDDGTERFGLMTHTGVIRPSLAAVASFA